MSCLETPVQDGVNLWSSGRSYSVLYFLGGSSAILLQPFGTAMGGGDGDGDGGNGDGGDGDGGAKDETIVREEVMAPTNLGNDA